MEDEYVKVAIYPVAHWIPPGEKHRRGLPINKLPDYFQFGDSNIHINKVVNCSQGVSRKVGGRGYRFICSVSWGEEDSPRTKASILWYDDFYDEWFVEVPESWALRRGMEYEKYSCTAEKEI